MLKNITYKTELEDIIMPEEIYALFNAVEKKYDLTIVALSVYPLFNKLRDSLVDKAVDQRNKELSTLLNEIANRRQELKINIWKVLGEIGGRKGAVLGTKNMQEELEQIMYEEKQFINVYEMGVRYLDIKETKIMSGKYQRVGKIPFMIDRKVLSRQLEELEKLINRISEKHNDCFAEFADDFKELIEKTENHPNNYKKATSSKENAKFSLEEAIEEAENNPEIEEKEYYNLDEEKEIDDNQQYEFEPDYDEPEDELIYKLLAQANYDENDGTVNGLIITAEFEDEY